MAVELTPIYYANNDTPMTLITLANAIVDVLATEVVTVNAHSDGALSIGNGYVSGIFGASVIVGGEFRGGSVDASANAVISSNLVSTDPTITIAIGNTTINSTYINVESAAIETATITNANASTVTIGNTVISSLTYQANGDANQVFDSFSKANYRSAEYLLSLADTSTDANSYQLMKILIIHDNVSVSITEYGIVTTNSIVGTVNASMDASLINVTLSPITATNVEIQATRTLMGT